MRILRRLFVILLLTVLSIPQYVVLAQESIRIGNVTARPGQKKSGFLHIPAGSDGPEQQIPITIVNGLTPGPVLALTAGVHGYEYPPILALQRLKKNLDPTRLSGAVLIVHVLNMPSFLKRTTYYNPHDWKNMNRVFPGQIDGTMTERIAFGISKHVIDQCDVLLDLHCGDGNEDLTPYLYYTETGDPGLDARTKELAVNFGFKIIVHETVKPNHPSSTLCANSALLKGKPALTVESGRLGRTDETDILRLIRGVENTTKFLGMNEGKIESLFKPIWIKGVTYIRSDSTGIFYALTAGGRHVEEGELLGYLTDFFGNVIQKAVAPHEGIVMYVISTPPMSKGEPMVKIGRF